VLGCLPLTRARLVPDSIEALLAEYPDVNVRVVDANFTTLFAMLMHGELDMLVGTLRDPLPAGTNGEFLLFDRVSIVARPEHPLSKQEVVSLKECMSYDWVLPSEAAPLRQFFGRCLQSQGIAFPKRYTEADSTVVGRSLLYKADRVAILSYFHVEQDVRWKRLSVLPVRLPDGNRKIGILTKEDYLPTPLIVAFGNALRTVAKQMDRDAAAER
jgi:LysR family transcriptional regulator of gallate degradation